MNFKIIKLNAFILNGIYREFTKDNLPEVPMYWESLDMEGKLEVLYEINDFKVIDGLIGACLKQEQSEHLRYLVSAACTSSHPDYQSIEIPACEWVVFDVPHNNGKTISENILAAFDDIYSTWFKTHPYRPLPYADLEYYQFTENSENDDDLEIKIYIPIEAI